MPRRDWTLADYLARAFAAFGVAVALAITVVALSR